ncbi:MAG: amidohydrolase family protein, partial [Gemmatimonadota bacterium]|nr:amidohydrolase family protein [Gemmatimonadota bacterium]
MGRKAFRRATVHLATLLLAAVPLAAQTPAAELVVTNARIYTVDGAVPIAEALAVSNGRVRFVGSVLGAKALTGPSTQVIDAGGRTVIPGMTDAHGHVLGLGLALRNVDLVGTTSYDEVIARVVARAR